MRALRPRVLPVLGGLLVTVALSGCSTAWPFAPPTPFAVPESLSPASPTPEAPVTIGVVGDSLSSGGPGEDFPADPGSWTRYLDSGMEVTGGWSRPGATTSQMAESVQPFSADALVILAGTNDVLQGIPFPQTLQNIRRIALRADVDAVVLSAVPPSAAFPDHAAALNRALRALAVQESWTWVDPWHGSRRANAWMTGMSPDGIHPSTTGYAKAALAIQVAVDAALGATGSSAADPSE